jgi:hypothetical protein
MRRIDVLGIGLGTFVAGGLAYALLQLVGLDSLEAGVWSQVLLVGGLIGWVVTYALRAVNQKMTYHQQRQDYEEAFLKKRLEQLAPEELAQLQAEIEQERSSKDATAIGAKKALGDRK